MTHSTEPPIVISEETIRCDGEPDSTHGHPAVYLHLKNGMAECPYCGRVFIQKTQKKS